MYGDASLKSFIGRVQEPHGMAEAELCSSTSDDVCELWSNGGICRVFGRPRILEFFYTPSAKFYPDFSAQASLDVGSKDPSCGIELPKDLFRSGKLSKGEQSTDLNGWEEVKPKRNDQESATESLRFAPYPNLSLNIGMRTVPHETLWIAVIFGVSLQLSFFAYATWATLYNQSLYDDGDSPQLWSFGLTMSGTALLVIGMVLCALLIEQKSCERRFRKKAFSNASSKTVMFWLQPGGQRVGDQSFDAFAHSEMEKKEYITSWRVSTPKEDPDALQNSSLILWIAIVFSLLGFVCQFTGLRGLHGSIALYQLASTLFMAIIRALLRSRRLALEQNRLAHLRRHVERYELDWQALNIERSLDKSDASSTESHGKRNREKVISIQVELT